ncbi:MAG: hypothetical protein LBV36_05990 [Chromatiales bacterium]|jgi:hypothetical protein|nr:hypothetical protein [Chromatiales bacterium]
MNLFRPLLCIALGMAVSSCSVKQIYSAGRAYQTNECIKLQDDYDRERCMADASISHEDYLRNIGAAPDHSVPELALGWRSNSTR